MDDDDQESADDALEDTRAGGLFHPETDEEQLPEDSSRPAAPADDVPTDAPLDDPATDTDVDADEAYDQGLGEAADNDDREISSDTRARPLEPEG